jgi:putative phage-type endonuclease
VKAAKAAKAAGAGAARCPFNRSTSIAIAAAIAANARPYKYKVRHIIYTTKISSSMSAHAASHAAAETTKSNKQNIDLCLLKYIKATAADIDINEATQFICKELNDINTETIKSRIDDIRQYQTELKVLLQLPLMKQRTTEWFEARKTRLTASDLYDAIKVTSGGSDTSVSIKLAKKKANIVAADTINYNAIPALKWGTMFEPMATRCYSQKMNDIAIHDFGLICATDNEHFGASPDGINELGIMLEIKCPYSRKIVDGVIPDKYKMQIQGQLAVCKLKECDYIECIFKSIENAEEYLELEDTAVRHGVIAEFYNRAGEYVYFYSEPDRTPSECLEDIRIIAEGIIKDGGSGGSGGSSGSSGDKLKFSKYTYWRLDEMIIQRVVFNAKEWLTIIPKINTFWEKVEEYKLLPIEIGIKKYAFVDDDGDADATGTTNTNTNTKSVGGSSGGNKFKFVDDDDE